MKRINRSAMCRLGVLVSCASMLLCAAACKRTRDPQPKTAGVDGHGTSAIWRAQAEYAPPGQQPKPDAALACYQGARFDLNLSDPNAYNLCASAPTSGPVQCFAAGRDGTFLVDDQLIVLCNATVAQQLRPNCAPGY